MPFDTQRIDGGPGTNACVLDQADLPKAQNCTTVDVPGGGGGGPGGDGNELMVTSATGLSCDSALPTCPFTVRGTGADGLAGGTVTALGGITVGLGVGVSVDGNGGWTAVGLYGCTGDGFLHIVIGSKSVDVPVNCA